MLLGQGGMGVLSGQGGGCVPQVALQAHCRERLAGYKRPNRYEFVEALPKTATGKIQRFKLRAVE